MFKLTCQIFLTRPVAHFCTLGFAPSPILPGWQHPRGLPRWFLAYSPAPKGPVIKLTCQIFLTHLVADYCTLGFTPLPIGPRWPHPRGQPRWFSAYSTEPGGPVINRICQIFLTRPVADFCPLGFAPSPIRPRWPHPRGWPRWFMAYSPLPWRPVTKLTCQIFLTHPAADFYTLGFSPSLIGPRWGTLGGGRDGSRPIALSSIGQ